MKDTITTDTIVSTKVEKKKTPKKSDIKKSWMGVLNLSTGQILTIDQVVEFDISDYGDVLCFIHQTNDSIDSTFVSKLKPEMDKPQILVQKEGFSKNVTVDLYGNQISFLFSADTNSSKQFSLEYLALKSKNLHVSIDTNHRSIPNGWSVSEHFKLRFSEDGSAIYFGLAPKPERKIKDTLTPDEKVSLDVWNWKDAQLQTQQLKSLESDQKKTFLAVYYPERNDLLPLASEQISEVRPDYKQHRKYLLGIDRKRYELVSGWEQTRYADVYLINRKSGSSKLLLERADGFYSLSPAADYLLFYQSNDSCWYSLNVESMRQIRLTNHSLDAFYNVDNDIPKIANAYGFAGWSEENTAVVYSRNHLWTVDLAGKMKPLKLTENASANDYVFRYVNLNTEEPLIADKSFLTVFDRRTKQSGFAKLDLKSGRTSISILEKARLSGLVKALSSDTFLYRKETFQNYPDLYISGEDMSKSNRISEANPQQADYCWGSVQLVDWKSFSGDSLQGLLYFPANFSADSSYPMLVYFYERHSNDLYRHFSPKPSRSVINITEYTSRGYFVFTPDIIYSTAQPGQSAYNAVMSGTQSMMERFSQIDGKRIGLQGQSWGGYQIAWLITRTNLFKAAMAGAPVSNMTSAYGGIRWESGVSRASQYEVGQSRIGGTLWSNLNDFIENSPLFYADRVQTPLLIMHNDADGAVPWYQGIEYFSALRRLNKPVWMLVYNNAPHNLTRRADSEDLTIRMQQFFDHYLKDAPEPEWMKSGIPALQKGKKKGFGTAF
ncbi:MAG: hypothetical protein CVT92_16495 [Bacteroidetes bacterium HGW-Bacteroidetes-1]|nr:MAG: hypothetical protein CVT92_16495 [Bacteroidetes bacterium HGW-Bacteroidetes-1]